MINKQQASDRWRGGTLKWYADLVKRLHAFHTAFSRQCAASPLSEDQIKTLIAANGNGLRGMDCRAVQHWHRRTLPKRRAPKGAPSSVRPKSNNVPCRVVVADPNLAALTPCDGATHGTSLGPDDLSVMAADTLAGIAAGVVVPCLGSP